MARLTDRSGRPKSGTVQNGVVGIVVDNVDPDKLGRVMVEYPTLPGRPKSHWLRQLAPMAGIERGLYSIPEPGDEVLVMFMQGSQDTGVIIGQMWNGKDKPPPEFDGGYPGAGATDTGGSLSTAQPTDGSGDYGANDRRYWRSRSGHLLMFDDTGGSESVQIWNNTNEMSFTFDTASQTVYLANAGLDIHIRCANDLIIEAGNDIKFLAGNNIEGEAGNATTYKSGTTIDVESGTDSTWKAGASFTTEATSDWLGTGLNSTLNADVGVTVKGGATSELSASGQTTVKGGIVMIN